MTNTGTSAATPATPPAASSDPGATPATPPAASSDPGATPKPEDLGAGGVKALEAERAARKAAEAERAALAARVKEFEDRDKSAEELAAQRAADAEKRALEVEARATRAETSAATGIPVEILAGPKSTSAEDLKAFAELVGSHITEASKKPGPVIPNQGSTPSTPAPTAGDDWLRGSLNR